MSYVTLTAPAAGSALAFDLISGAYYARSKMSFGIEGVAVDVSATNPMPVTFGPLPAGTNSIGNVGITGSVAVTGTFWPATQPVSGSVGLTGSLPAFASTPTFNLGTAPALTLAAGTAAIGSITNTSFGISGSLPAFAATPTFNLGTAPALVLGAGAAAIGSVTVGAALPTGANTIGTVNLGTLNGAATDATLAQVRDAIKATVNVNGLVFFDNVPATPLYLIRRETVNEGTGVISVAWFNLDGSAANPSAAVIARLQSVTNAQNITTENEFFVVTTAGTGYSVGDLLIHAIGLDTATSPQSIAYNVWINTTTGLLLASAPASGSVSLMGAQTLDVQAVAYQATAAGTGYAIGDILVRAIGTNVATATPTQAFAYWQNQTQGTYLAAAPTTGTYALPAQPVIIPANSDAAAAAINITAADTVSVSTVGANAQPIVTGAPTANSAAVFALASADTAVVQVTGTFVGTLVVEQSYDGGTTWLQVGVHLSGTTFTGNSLTAQFAGRQNCVGATQVRVRATAWTSGTAAVRVVASKNPGNVYVANSPAVGAGSAIIGSVLGRTRRTAPDALTVTAAAYTAGNVVGGLLKFTGALDAAFSGLLQSFRLRSKSINAGATFDLYLFSSNPTASTFTDKAAPNLNVADYDKVMGPFSIAVGKSGLGTHTSWTLDAIGAAIAQGAADVYAVLIATGTAPTFASTSDLTASLVLIED